MDAETIKDLIGQPAMLCVLMYAASLVSALQEVRRKRNNGLDINLGEYLKFWPETIGVIVSNAIAFVLLIASDQLNLAAALGIGYGLNFAVDAAPGARTSPTGLSDQRAATQAKIDDKGLGGGGQGGFARVAALILLAAVVAVPLPAILVACTGTKAAYEQAGENKSASDYAFVLANHYTLLVEEAAELKNLPTTPQDAVDAMRAADLAAAPGIERLHTATTAYDALANAQTQAELQAATDAAVTLVADLVRAIARARGK